MKIISYETWGATGENLHFSEMTFGKLNLVVGNSATGKTRLLNTIFNGASLVTKKAKFFMGAWEIIFEHQENKYRWMIDTRREGDEGAARVEMEQITQIEDDGEKLLVDRTRKRFIFNDKELPKLSPRESSISILQEEELIIPLFEGLQRIMRRDFSGPDLDLATSLQSVPQNFLNEISRTKDLDAVFSAGIGLSCKLLVLSLHFKHVYERICREFLSIFPFVRDVRLRDAHNFNLNLSGKVPVFALKEHHMDEWVPINQFSSGMKKVLLILTDIFLLPEDGGVYLIDEYENSLGMNAINFFPSVLLDVDSPSQFIITSHHPYIVGNVPVRNWIVLHRKGADVLVKQGSELEERFGKSKQAAFMQLLNDPFYAKGIEV